MGDLVFWKVANMLYGRKNKKGQNILLEMMQELMKGMVIDITKFITTTRRKVK